MRHPFSFYHLIMEMTGLHYAVSHDHRVYPEQIVGMLCRTFPGLQVDKARKILTCENFDEIEKLIDVASVKDLIINEESKT